MELSRAWIGFINLLIYGVQFSPDPLLDVERITQWVVQESDIPPVKYIAAIREALGSETPLVPLLIPQDHSEAVIRSFLSKVLDQLATITSVKQA